VTPVERTDHAAVAALVDFLAGRRFVALTGAGISTESGIPDYRGPGTRARARDPLQHRAFTSELSARARYWARSTIGYPRFRGARPNGAHHALAALEETGLCAGVITQNVDRLHQAAGSRTVIELHGALAEVRCLGCGAIEPRDALQTRLLAKNPTFAERVETSAVALAPDGDAELDRSTGFVVPDCLDCGGILKPDVVFFGDNVPRARVEAAFALLSRGDALLVIGTSLAVFSGYRFVLRASEAGLPIAIVNLGESRGDPHARLRIDAAAGSILPAVATALSAAGLR
jgi:NAD-dependent SIR2 family protein deacetylase